MLSYVERPPAWLVNEPLANIIDAFDLSCFVHFSQILVIPLPSAESHTFVMVKIVEELVSRGNDILVSAKCLQ